MRDILRQSNLNLLHEIEKLGKILRSLSDSIPTELDIYYNWVINTCDKFRQRVMMNLPYLDLGRDDILPDILGETQVLTLLFQEFNRLVSPILRARPSDRLCLKLLRWLHAMHPKTQSIPVALSDGDFASWPDPSLPTIYFMPCSAQYGLLYLPLLFHEHGHLLYICHKPEMDDLVRSLQEQIRGMLIPSIQRDDLYAQIGEERLNVIVETWYEWTQELFCDAVGYVIGGPAFIHSFSMHLRMFGRGEYHMPPEQLANREHPVTWLRIRILTDRARSMGYDTDAEVLENTWSMIASTMGVIEDYYGFYIPDFLPAIQQTIDDMLTEAEPRSFNEQESQIHNAEMSLQQAHYSPVLLLNQVWQRFLEDLGGYRAWEESAISAFLGS